MSAPKRIQRRRVKGWRKPEGCVIVDRTSRWGNPHRISQPKDWHGSWKVDHPPRSPRHAATYSIRETEADARQCAVDFFDAFTLPLLDVTPLRGKDLACTCDPADGMACHADVLLKAANR